MKSVIVCLAIMALFLFSGSFVSAQDKANTEAINKLIDKYSALEDAGDMMAQAKLMTKDRVWVGGTGGRRTNQSMNMEIQQAGFDEDKNFVPGVKWFTDARDRLIKFYGDESVAVASFYWYTTFVLPTDTPPEKAESFGPSRPTTVTLVLEKGGGDWKIVHTHSSPLGFPPPGNN